MKRLRWALPWLLAAQLFCTPVFAWGILGHELIIALAIRLTPPNTPFGNFLQRNRELLMRYGITPDWEWKKPFEPNPDPALQAKQEDNGRTEGPLHFWQPDTFIKDGKVDLKAIAELPIGPEYKKLIAQFAQLMVQNQAYVQQTSDPNKPPINFANPTAGDLNESGTLPWRVSQLFGLTVDALKRHDFQKAAYYLGTVGHYLGDTSMPFHGSRQYNPGGIHSVFEEKILEWAAKQLGDVVDPIRKLWNLDKTLQVIADNLGQIPQMIAMDRETTIGRIYRMFGTGFEMKQPLIDAWNAAKARFPVPPPPPGAPPPAPGERPRTYTNQAADAFAATPITFLGPDGKPQQMTVLDAAHQRLGEAGVMLQQFWAAAYEEALRADPTLAKELGNAPKLPEFNQAYAINNYPKPDYLPADATPAAKCGEYAKLAH